MIDLTPLDVRKKRDDFKRAVRGYDPVQVDAFLELVSDRLEQLLREHGTLSDQVGHMKKQLETYQERERALNEALLAAQELREEARSQSERDAAVRLREAETHAEAILLDADQAIRHSARRLEDLRARRRQFLKSLRSVMERFEDYLELEETRLETEPEDMGDLLERLESDLTPATEEPARRHETHGGAPSGPGTPLGGADDSGDATVAVDGRADAPGDRVADADSLSAPSANGHAERAARSTPDVAAPGEVESAEEAESGSRIATPHPITGGDAGVTGSSSS
ncbi:MAG: DivIVA domain-containing protein [Gemmatimonadota bacterium]|nr:DivIVA domain-containing protein [Gemmatimonadota bacterium]